MSRETNANVGIKCESCAKIPDFNLEQHVEHHHHRQKAALIQLHSFIGGDYYSRRRWAELLCSSRVLEMRINADGDK